MLVCAYSVVIGVWFFIAKSVCTILHELGGCSSALSPMLDTLLQSTVVKLNIALPTTQEYLSVGLLDRQS